MDMAITRTREMSSEDKSKPIKLALLLCDTPTPKVLETHGTYLDIFRKQLQDSNPNASFPFTIDGYDVVKAQEYPNLDDGYEAVLLSGSAFSAYEDKPWINKLVEWVRDVAFNRPEIRLIGICFGHQIIARALGGDCVPNKGKWEIGTTDMELTDVGKAVFQTTQSTMPIQQMHRDHVPHVPQKCYSLGSSPVTPVQGFIKVYSESDSDLASAAAVPRNVHIFTVQGHPEFTGDIVSAIISVREQAGILNPETVREGRERAFRPHEGIGAIGRAIWRVLGVNAPPAPA